MPNICRLFASLAVILSAVALHAHEGAHSGSPDPVIKQLATMPIKSAETEWSYNQINSMLREPLIQKYSNLPYREYFQARVLAPLGVTGVMFSRRHS